MLLLLYDATTFLTYTQAQAPPPPPNGSLSNHIPDENFEIVIGSRIGLKNPFAVLSGVETLKLRCEEIVYNNTL